MKQVKPRKRFNLKPREDIELHPPIEEDPPVVENKPADFFGVETVDEKPILEKAKGAQSFTITLVNELMTAAAYDPGTIVGQVHFQSTKRFVHVWADTVENALKIGSEILLPGQRPKTKQAGFWTF